MKTRRYGIHGNLVEIWDSQLSPNRLSFCVETVMGRYSKGLNLRQVKALHRALGEFIEEHSKKAAAK